MRSLAAAGWCDSDLDHEIFSTDQYQCWEDCEALGFNVTAINFEGSMPISAADIGAYPTLPASPEIDFGQVLVESYGYLDGDRWIRMHGALHGLEPNVMGGIHIHSGTSCETHEEVGGHFYVGDSDPWLNTYYFTNENGEANVDVWLQSFDQPYDGRTVVVHDEVSSNSCACPFVAWKCIISSASNCYICSFCHFYDVFLLTNQGWRSHRMWNDCASGPRVPLPRRLSLHEPCA